MINISFIEKLNNRLLYLLVFSIVFEYWDPIGFGNSFSLTFLSTALYFISSIPLMKTNFNINLVKKYIAPLLLLILSNVISAAVNARYVNNLFDIIDFRFVQLVVLMFLIASHLVNNQHLIKKVLYIYVISVSTMYIFYLVDIGVVFEKGRLYLNGENPNMLGLKSAIAIVIVAYYILNDFSLKKLILGLFLSFPIINLIFLSASRGALVSMILGVFLVVVFLKSHFIKKVSFFIMIALFIPFFFSYLMDSQKVFFKRIDYAIQTGNTGRNVLWEAAYRIFEDNPVTGVGISGLMPEMYHYSGIMNGPHNVYLYVLVTTGLIGFSFFMFFLIRLGNSIKQNLRKTGEVIFLIIFLVILFNMFKAGGGINKIIFWFFFAVTISSTITDGQEQKGTLL